MTVKYKTSSIPNKGLGLIVTEKILAGELIVSEEPLVFVSYSQAVSARFSSLQKNPLKKNFDSLVVEKREVALKLFSARGLKPGDAGFETDVFKTNSMPCGEDERNGGAIYSTISRINHSCKPNANHFWDASQNKELIHALRDIETGEEITIFYGHHLHSNRKERQADLLQKFAFTCGCEVCSLTGQDLVESNRAKRSLALLVEAAPSLIHSDPEQAIQWIKLADRIFEKEGILVEKGRLHYDAFQVCTVWSDYTNAKVWAQR